MQPSSTLQPVGTQQHVETHPDTTEAEEQSLPSIDLPPDADFYGDYLQKLKEITWRFEISLETYLMERGINRERKPISSWKTRIKSPDSMREKLIKRGYEPTAENAVYAVHDAAGVRVICPLVDDVETEVEGLGNLDGEVLGEVLVGIELNSRAVLLQNMIHSGASLCSPISLCARFRFVREAPRGIPVRSNSPRFVEMPTGHFQSLRNSLGQNTPYLR